MWDKCKRTLVENWNNTVHVGPKLCALGAFGMRDGNFMHNSGYLRCLCFVRDEADLLRLETVEFLSMEVEDDFSKSWKLGVRRVLHIAPLLHEEVRTWIGKVHERGSEERVQLASLRWHFAQRGLLCSVLTSMQKQGASLGPNASVAKPCDIRTSRLSSRRLHARGTASHTQAREVLPPGIHALVSSMQVCVCMDVARRFVSYSWSIHHSSCPWDAAHVYERVK